MGTITFSDYIASRPAVTTPVGVDDRILILQGGAVKRVASSDVGGGLVPAVLIDAGATPITVLPASGEIVYAKSDASATICVFVVSVAGQTMCQELQNGLSTQNEILRVKLIGTNWYKIG